jgi:hypothetical protein
MAFTIIKRTLFFSFIILCLSFVSDAPWKTMTYKKFNFKIDFPKKPTSKPSSINSGVGKLKLNMFVYDASKDQDAQNQVYLVNYTEYPEGLVDSRDTAKLDGIFRSSIDGAAKNVNGKILSEKTISLRGFPGREVKISFQEGLDIITMRIYLVNNKMYLLETIAETAKDGNDVIARFMNSFDLLH